MKTETLPLNIEIPAGIDRPRDKYDDAIDYLTEIPEEIYKAWEYTHHPAHCLFLFARQHDTTGIPREQWDRYFDCGCLTMIRNNAQYKAFTDDLTTAIHNDARIPVRPGDITDLQIFGS